MARIAGVDISDAKVVRIGLRYIYGIGPALSDKILAQAGINPNVRVKDLKEQEMSRLRNLLSKEFIVEGDLRRQVSGNIRRLIEISSYKGMRHQRRLPVRGQRTRTNARTKRGARQTVAGRGKRRGVTKK